MTEDIRYIDLCCGIGGFRVGIEAFQQGNQRYRFNCVYSADIKDDAIETYNANFGESMTRRDIYDIKELPAFDLLCAGFPCQPFSSAGNKLGFEDSRGGMIFKILELCERYKPPFVLLENVPNLISLENGKYISEICQLFHDLDYHVTYKKLNSVDFGVPQSRERVYIICSLKGNVSFDSIKSRDKRKLRNIIENDVEYTDIDESLANKILSIHKTRSVFGCKLQDKRGGSNNIHSWDIGYNGEISNEEKDLMNLIMLERRKKHWAEKKGIQWMDGMPLSYQDIKTFYEHINLASMLDNLVKLKYLKIEKCKELKNGRRLYKEESEEGYNICKGKLSFPISKILDPEGVAPTLTATDSSKLAFLIGDKHVRRATDNELKRMCGFPDSFIIPQDVNKFDLFGNMVTPPVITALLEIMYS